MGYRLKPKNFRSWLRPIRDNSDVPVSRNWYKNLFKQINGSPSVSRDMDVIIILPIIFIKNEKLLNSNTNSLWYRRFQIGCVFAEYDLF